MSKYRHKILAIGPLPPPLAGTSVSFNAFCEEARTYPDALQLSVINSAPKELGQKSLLTTGHLTTAMKIVAQLLMNIWRVDRVYIFGSNQFLNFILPICVPIAIVARKPLYIRVFGGSLDHYYSTIPRWRRWLLHRSIDASKGLIVQTELLAAFFKQHFQDKVYLVPGYRTLPRASSEAASKSSAQCPLRLVFLGHVREEKGIFTLLESLRAIETKTPGLVHCDIYGPVYAKNKVQFEEEMSLTPNATAKGVLEHVNVHDTISTYDALVFPTTYLGEGHPGVLIEAIMASLPIITTNHRSIPEIIKPFENGLLVTPDSHTELTGAIQMLANDRNLLSKLRNNVSSSKKQFDAIAGVQSLLLIAGVDTRELAIDNV